VSRLHDGGRFVSLPTYPWQGKRFWVGSDPRPADEERSAPAPAALPATEPAVESALGLAEWIARVAAELLAVPSTAIDLAAPLCRSGMDSLLATNLGTRLRKDLDVRVRVADLLGSHSVLEVAERLHTGAADQEAAVGGTRLQPATRH
jgi:acyl transferase domain-containing protein